MLARKEYRWFHLPYRDRSHGFSLIEMMVAVTIGLVITLVVMSSLVSQQVMRQWQHAISDVNETGHFIANFFARDFRLAGYIFDEQNQPSVIGNNGDGLNSDSVTIRYHAKASNYRDCIGKNVQDTIVNHYYVKKINDQVSGLYCNGQALIDHVENLQFLYGVDDNNDMVPDRYINGSDILVTDNIIAIQVEFLVRSSEKVSAESKLVKLLDLPSYYASSDGYLRETFSQTVILVNQYHDEG